MGACTCLEMASTTLDGNPIKPTFLMECNKGFERKANTSHARIFESWILFMYRRICHCLVQLQDHAVCHKYPSNHSAKNEQFQSISWPEAGESDFLQKYSILAGIPLPSLKLTVRTWKDDIHSKNESRISKPIIFRCICCQFLREGH